MARKRKRRKSSSSSSQEDEKERQKGVSSSRRREKRRHESCAAKQHTSVSSSPKHESRSTRQIRPPKHRVSTDQRPHHKAEECTKTQSVSFHRGNSSSRAKSYASGTNESVSGSKTVERGRSRPDAPGASHQKTDRSFNGSLGGNSSSRSPSKCEKLMSPSLAPAEKKEKISVPNKRPRAEEPPRTRQDSVPDKMRQPSKPSWAFIDSLERKRRELVKKKCQRQDLEIKAKSSRFTKAESTSSASATNQSSTSTRTITSAGSPKLLKNVTSAPSRVTSFPSATATSASPRQQRDSVASPPLLRFKIPKKTQPAAAGDNRAADSANRTVNSGARLSDSKATRNESKQERASNKQPLILSSRQDKRSSFSDQIHTVCEAAPEPQYDQMQVVNELHLARTEKKLDVDITQSYGELTCMDIDPPEEGASSLDYKQPPQQDLILVLDTNILLSHLDCVRKIRSHGLGAWGFPVILIPWVVLQELDSLKRGRGLTGSVAHLATPAISYIHTTLKSREPRLWGQSMQQASDSSNGLNTENNDDRVLQCCLQYQSLYPGCAVILCTNDKNLCSKALLSGVKALSKKDLEAEVRRSGPGLCPLQHAQTHTLPCTNPCISSPVLARSCTANQPHLQERGDLSVGPAVKYNPQLSGGDGEKARWNLSRCISELEDSLQEVLSDVLEVEMKAAYQELWSEIVYVKPPWSLQDVLNCLKKHWIAVFGHVVPRGKQQTVLNLIEFFNSGKTVDCDATVAAIQQAKDLVQAFGKSSSRVPGAISKLDCISRQLQRQGESPASDVVMNDEEEDDPAHQPRSAEVSHQEVWALFENIWCNVYQMSLQVFKALGFDPDTMRCAQAAGHPPPPQDALACLHKLSSMVSQLLQAFSSILSSVPCLEDVQTLLSIIHANKIVDVDSRLTARDLLDCFSQQDYREKLRIGGSQLLWLKGALDGCAGAIGQNIGMQP